MTLNLYDTCCPTCKLTRRRGLLRCCTADATQAVLNPTLMSPTWATSVRASRPSIRYADVHSIKRGQEAVEDPEPTFLEPGLEHWSVISRIRRLGLPRSPMLVRIQQFLDARVCAAFKVARPAHGADLLAQPSSEILKRFGKCRDRRIRCRKVNGLGSPTPTVPTQHDPVRHARTPWRQLLLAYGFSSRKFCPMPTRWQRQVSPSANLCPGRHRKCPASSRPCASVQTRRDRRVLDGRTSVTRRAP